MICDLLALRPISHITKKTLSYLHSTKIEQMTKTMVIFKRGAIFLCCIRCDPIPPQTSVQRLAHTRNVTTCCSGQHSLTSVERPSYLRSDFVNLWCHARLEVFITLKYVIHLHFDRLYPTCLIFCERFCPTFLIIPRLIPIYLNKKMPLPSFNGCFDVSSLFLLHVEKDLSADVTK